jgi:hypothetical protein
MASEKSIQFTFQVEAGPDSDPGEIDVLTRRLLAEIRAIDVEEAKIPASSSAPPDGTKPGEVITIGQIAIQVLPALIPSLVLLVQSWLLRQQSQTVKVKIGEIEVEIPRDLSDAELNRIVDRVKQVADQK